MFTPQIESLEKGTPEAQAACRRAWQGWKRVWRDDNIIYRKEYPSVCVERFRRLQRELRQICLAYALQKKHRRSMDPTSEVGVFCGYAGGGYVLWIPARQHFIVSPACAFKEKCITVQARAVIIYETF